MDLQSAADRLGVHYQTAYRWVRDGSLVAVKRGALYDIHEDEIARFAERRLAPAPPPKQAHVRSWQHQIERLHVLLLAGDELDARQLVDRLREGRIEPMVLCEELFTPTLRQIGIDWEAGRVSVAEEHRASAICERLLVRLGVHPRGRPRGICVVATTADEEHSIPAAMAALVLRADRWQVHHLGIKVPTPDLVSFTRAVDAALVVLSVTTPSALAETQAAADAVREATDAAVLVGIPGTKLSELVSVARELRKPTE